MDKDAKSKRLDKIEIQLTPKQWAINLAVEMRRYASQEEFLKAIAKGTYRQSPFTKPFYALAQQAEERWPGQNQEHWCRQVELGRKLRAEERWPGQNQEHRCRQVELDRKLRAEFHALKMLINDTNSTIKSKAETNKLKAKVQLSTIRMFILEDALVPAGVAETTSGSSGDRARALHVSQLEDWADVSAKLLMDTTADNAVVQTIQKNYFDTHPILFKDNEIEFENAIRMVREAIATFNEYLKARANLYNREPGQKQHKAEVANVMLFERESKLPIDIEVVEKSAEIFVDIIAQQWVKHAEIRGTADILQETGEHEEYIWGHFRNEMGLDPKSGMSKPPRG